MGFIEFRLMLEQRRQAKRRQKLALCAVGNINLQDSENTQLGLNWSVFRAKNAFRKMLISIATLAMPRMCILAKAEMRPEQSGCRQNYSIHDFWISNNYKNNSSNEVAELQVFRNQLPQYTIV